MRSSEPTSARRMLRIALAVTTVLVAACSPMPPASQAPAPAAAADCTPADAAAPRPDAQAVAELRRAVEAGPLYAVASQSGVAACRVTQDSGAIRLDYTFRDRTTLRSSRNVQIEYSDQEVRFATPLRDSAVPILTRTEQAAFDGKGCDIDWERGDTRPASDDPSARETIYRGDTCNCQARVRSDANGGVVGLLFRSAC